MEQDRAPETYGDTEADTYQPPPSSSSSPIRVLRDRAPQLAARDARVRQLLDLPPETLVTDTTVARAHRVLRRRETKAKQSMDYRTLVKHFQERAEAARHGQPPAPASRRVRRELLHQARRIAYRNGRLAEPTPTA